MISKIRMFAKARNYAFRTLIIISVLAVVAAGCLGRLAVVQLFDGQSTAQAATQARTIPVTITAKRGRILDANGKVLAQSVERYNVIGNPEAAATFTPITCGSRQAKVAGYCHKIKGRPVGATGAAAVARLLATVLDMNAMELGGTLAGSGQYAMIKRDVEPATMRRIENLHLGGVVYGELSSERVYANGTLMGALLGGVDSEGKGVAGIEQIENERLTGTDGVKVYQQGGGGEEIPGTVTESKDAVDGSDVSLTIDADVDWYVKKVLKDAKEEYKADWVLAVVQEAATGRIVALEDTDEYEAGSDEAKMNTSRAVSQTFEPGSIGKVITMAGLVQEGLHQGGDKFTVPDKITIDGQTYEDSFNHGAEHWTLAGIIEQSSNVGTVMASDKYSNEKRYEFLTKFGIGQKSALGLPGESQGVLYEPGDWDGRTQNTILFGQGYMTNALQLNNAISIIANKGVKRDQSIIRSVTDANGHVTETPVAEGERVIDENTAAQVLNAMESASSHYDQFVKVPGYRIAAKSGTAEVAGPDGRLTSVISDWSAIIPADNPQFVVTVVMKDPQGQYGGLTAGPVFAKIGEFLMQKYDVPVSQPRQDAIPVTW